MNITACKRHTCLMRWLEGLDLKEKLVALVW